MKINLLALLISFKKNLGAYFSLNYIKTSFLNAILLSAFIYLSILNSVFFSTIGLFLACFGFYRMLMANTIIWTWSGFFIGIFWFYWISFSLVYFNFAFLIPVEILGIGLIYGIIFAFASFLVQILSKICAKFYPNKFLKPLFYAIAFFLVQFIHPFGFNWLNWQITLINTPFEKILKNGDSKNLPFVVELAQSQISQNLRWNKNLRQNFNDENLAFIDNAIKNKARLVILPESAFPYLLNTDLYMISILKEKSQQIAILAGAEAIENNKIFNSAYFFDKGEIKRIDKHILVPFAEEIPLPLWAKKIINSIFFGGADDFGKADDFSYIDIDGVKIKVGICYEGTYFKLYDDKPEFVAIISNNAWFVKSTQSALQRLILKYYALRNTATILHSTNGSTAQIIKF